MSNNLSAEVGPGRHAHQASALAVQPHNVELSAARRARLLAAFRSLPVSAQADLLEAVESWAWRQHPGMSTDFEQQEARRLVRQVYAAAGPEFTEERR